MRILSEKSQDLFPPLFDDHRKRRIHGHVLMHFGPANKLLLIRQGEGGYDHIDYYLTLENPHSPGTIEPNRDIYELANSVHKIDDPHWTPSFCIKATRTLPFQTIPKELQVHDFFDYEWPPATNGRKRGTKETTTTKENMKENSLVQKKQKTGQEGSETKNGGNAKGNKSDEKKAPEKERSDDDDDDDDDGEEEEDDEEEEEGE